MALLMFDSECVQVLTMGLFRAVSLVYLAYFDHVVARCYRDKRRHT